MAEFMPVLKPCHVKTGFFCIKKNAPNIVPRTSLSLSLSNGLLEMGQTFDVL